MQKKTRNNVLDILKMLAIVLMVMGHSGFPFSRFIYLFHVPVFFMLSGYCFHEKNTDTLGDMWNLLRRRIRTLYLPFVLFSLLFLAFHNVFIQTGLYWESPHVITGEKVSNVCGFETPYTWDVFCSRNFWDIFIMRNHEFFLTPFWFLRSLFVATIFFSSMMYLLRKIFKERIAQVFVYVIPTLLFACDLLLRDKIPGGAMLAFLASPLFLFLLGYGLRSYTHYYEKISFWKIQGVCWTILLGIFCLTNGSVVLVLREYPNPFFLVITSLCGWFMLYSISQRLQYSRFHLLFIEIGQGTIFILALHCLCFKFVNFLVVLYTGDSWILMGNLLCPYENQWLWILYTFFGVTVPILIRIAFCFTYQRFLERVRGLIQKNG